MLYDFDLNEAIDIYDFVKNKRPVVVVKENGETRVLSIQDLLDNNREFLSF